MTRMFFAALSLMVSMGAQAAAAFASAEPVAGHAETGLATYYAHRFEGRRTASGDTFRNAQLMAAHPSYPFGTVVRVTNLATGDSVIVRIADRGPSGTQQRRGVIIDVSRSAATQLNLLRVGRASVSVQVLEWGTGQQRPGWSFERAATTPESARSAPYPRESEPPADVF